MSSRHEKRVRYTAFGFGLAMAAVGIPHSVAQTRPEPLPPETVEVRKLEGSPGQWIWVNDIVGALGVGRASLFDTRSGQMLGMLNTGMAPFALDYSKDGTEILAVETYFSRGSRGTRTDVVSVYDAATLAFKHEIEIPAKTYSGVPKKARTGVLDDGRWLVTTNFTSGQSITIVDLKARRFAAEAETAGCVSVYPIAPGRFFMICGDGQLLDVKLDASGKPSRMERAAKLLDFASDLVFEQAVRHEGRWIFVTYRGRLIKVGLNKAGALTVDPPIALSPSPENEKEPLFEIPGVTSHTARWQIAGIQPIAVSPERNELFVLAHHGPRHSMQGSSTDVYVYDLGHGKLQRQLKLAKPATSIELTDGPEPMLAAAYEGAMELDVYHPVSGKLMRSIEAAGVTPMVLQKAR